MTDAVDPAILALLAEARMQFAASLPAKVAELEALLGRAAWDELRRAAHKLRGSAGTYGFVDVSSLASAIEEVLLAVALAPGAAERDTVAAEIRQLTVAAGTAAGAPAR